MQRRRLGEVRFVGDDHEGRMFVGCLPTPRQANSDQRDRPDSTEPMLPNDSEDIADPAEPTEQIDRTDPMDPIDRTEPTLPMQRIDPSDRIDRMDRRECSERIDFVVSAIPRSTTRAGP